MSKFFIRRPIVAIVIAILMTLVGAVSMIQLPIAQYPNIVPPEIQVRANYTGADAQTIEQSVATPIEQQMSGVDKSNYIQSVNANGSIRMTINFDVATDPNVDHILAQMRVNQASSQLPQDVVNAGLTVQKSTTAPLLLIALNSPKGTYNNVFLANYANINLIDQITRVPRSEEHTSELQSRSDLVCRLLLEKKNRTSSVIGVSALNSGAVGSR